MIAVRDQDQVLRLAALPERIREGYLARMPYPRLMELVNVAQEMRQSMSGLGRAQWNPTEEHLQILRAAPYVQARRVHDVPRGVHRRSLKAQWEAFYGHPLVSLREIRNEVPGIGGMAGLGFFPAIGAFLFSAAKVAGAVGTAAISAGVASALAPKQPAPAPAPPPPPARQSMTPILIAGGLLLVGVVLLSGGRRRGRR